MASHVFHMVQFYVNRSWRSCCCVFVLKLFNYFLSYSLPDVPAAVKFILKKSGNHLLLLQRLVAPMLRLTLHSLTYLLNPSKV